MMVLADNKTSDGLLAINWKGQQLRHGHYYWTEGGLLVPNI